MRSLRFALVLSGAVLLLFGRATADTVSVDVLRAERLYTDGNYQASLAILNGYLAQHASDARALVDRGDALQALAKNEAAIADYSAAIAIDPDNAYARASRCETYYSVGEKAKAQADCARSIQVEPEQSYAYRVRASMLLEDGTPAAAVQDADNAVRYGSDNAPSYALRCRVRYALGNFDGASADCAQALTIDVQDETAQFYNGRLQLRSEQFAAAERTFSDVLKSDPGSTGSYYWRAFARYRLGNDDAALSDINHYLSDNADDGDAYLLRASIDARLRRRACAIDDAIAALHHYRLSNDNEGALRARQFLDTMSPPKRPT